MAKANKENQLRFRVVISPDQKQLFDFLFKAGGYYRGRHLVRLASIGLAVEQGAFQFSEITVKTANAGDPNATAPKSQSRSSTRKKASLIEEKSAEKHYEIPADAADALSNMFDTM